MSHLGAGSRPKPLRTLVTGCSVCGKKETTSRCGRCKTVEYCGTDHQTAHWAAHKDMCNKIRKAFNKYKTEEKKLRDDPGDILTPGNLLEDPDAIGHFWSIFETRDYMRARYDWIHNMMQTRTKSAVETSLDNMEDMFRLCRGDNMGLRYQAAHFYLRLGRDQDCYDFCKFWRNLFYDENYDYGDNTAPYLNLKNEDVFEPVDHFVKDWPDISFAAAVMLIKIRILLDLQMLQRIIQESGQPITPEKVSNGQEKMLSSIISANRQILERNDHMTQIKELAKQIQECFEGIAKANEHYWPMMLKPGNHLNEPPAPYMPGSLPEAGIMLQYSYYSFAETAGAMKIIQDLKSGKKA